MRGMLRKALAAVARALRASAALVALPVYAVIEGVRTIIGWLRPNGGMPLMDDVAGEVVEDVLPAPSVDGERLDEVRAKARLSQPERVRRAAQAMEFGWGVGPELLDPADREEAEILEWLRRRDALDLGMIQKASDNDLNLHFASVQRLRMALLPRDQAPLDNEKEARAERHRPPTREEWVMIMASEAARMGDDDPDVDELYAKAERLVAEGATLQNRRTGGGVAPGASDELDEEG